MNLLEEEQKIKECEENKIRQHQSKNNDKVFKNEILLLGLWIECSATNSQS